MSATITSPGRETHLLVLSCVLTSGLHHHGSEQGRLHRQERPEGHFCCSRYVDISYIQSDKMLRARFFLKSES